MLKPVFELCALVLVTASAAASIAELSFLCGVTGIASGAFMLLSIIKGYFDALDTNSRLCSLELAVCKLDKTVKEGFAGHVPSIACPANFTTPPPDTPIGIAAQAYAYQVERDMAAREEEISMLRKRRGP
jgi:hypothetical protein